MLRLALNGGILSSIWDAIKSIVTFFTNFTDILKGIFQATIIYAYSIFYYLFMSICSIVNFAEMLFKKLAGIDPIMTDRGEMNILDVFIKSNEIWGLFVSIIILSIVLLFIFTIVAVIKSEFSLDAKSSAKGPIIARSLKSLAMFLIVPAVSLMGIYAVNAITDTINSMMKGSDETTMVNQVFYAMSYNANKARINKEFADFINGYSSRNGDKYANDNGGAFKGSQDQVAYQIDMAFKGNLKCEYKYKWISFPLDMIDAQDFSTLFMPVIGSRSTYSIWDITQVNLYYSVMDMDYIVGLGSALVITYMLLSMCVVLVKRIFEIVILLLLAAPMISLAPLDGGSASKKWQGEFIKRVIAIVAPVFAINMYFIMIPLFSRITLFNPVGSLGAVGAISLSNVGSIGTVAALYATYDTLFQLLLICVGMSVVKTASALLCNLLGIQDLLKEGHEQTKKAVGTVAAVAATVATGGAAAGAMMSKISAGKKQKGAQQNLASTEKNVSAAKEQLAAAEASGDQAKIAKAKENLDTQKSKRDDASKNLAAANKEKKHADDLAKEKREAFMEKVAPTAFKGFDDVRSIRKKAGKTKADIAADDEKKKIAAQETAKENYAEDQKKSEKTERQENLKYRAQGQVEHYYDSRVSQANATKEAASRNIEEQRGIRNTEMLLARGSLGAYRDEEAVDTTGMSAGQKGWNTRRKNQHRAAYEEHAGNAQTAQESIDASREEMDEANAAIATATKNKKKAIKALQSGRITLDEGAGGIETTGLATKSAGQIAGAAVSNSLLVPGVGGAVAAGQIVADNIENKNLRTGRQNVDEALAAQQSTNQQNVDSEATKDIQDLEDSKKELDAQAMGEGVQQGLSEAMSQLSDMITNALNSAKLNVNDIKNLAAEVKSIKTDIKRAKDGDEGAKTLEEIVKAINDLANKIK